MKTVEPIRDRGKLTEIMEGLERDSTRHGRRMYLLFATMFYTGLRVCDVVKLQKRHVMGTHITTVEQKTGKQQKIEIAPDLRAIFDERLKELKETDYLFPSRKRRKDGTDQHITTRDAGYDMKIIKTRFNINHPFACHSLRKTHGYVRYVRLGDSLEVLRQHFNHADEATTRRYIGIDEEERNKNLRKLHAGDYRPPRPEQPTRRKGKEGAELEITRQDREENGRKWGESKKEAARRAKEQAEQEAKSKEEKKQRKKEYDAERYQKRKAAKQKNEEENTVLEGLKDENHK